MILRLDKLSLSMEEGQVIAWLVADGDEVAEGQPLAEVETDKATEIVESPASGVIRLLVAEMQIVPVETPLAEIGAEAPGDASAPSPEPAVTAPSSPAAAPPAPETIASGRQAVSPAARARARELGVDIAGVQGTGPGGRVVVADVSRRAREAPAPAPVGDLRAAVVAGLSASWSQIPHIHIGGELAADGLAEAKTATGSATTRVTVSDLLILAVARALQDVPDLNGSYVAGQVRRSAEVNLALAVATDQGITAPVIRGAHLLDLDAVSRERTRLVDAARAGTLDRHELGGATCTLSNLGAYPVDFFAPVIAGPQIALVATGRLAQKPVASGGMVGVGHRLWVNAAIDHRAADGEAGGRFLAALERRLAELPHTVVQGPAR